MYAELISETTRVPIDHALAGERVCAIKRHSPKLQPNRRPSILSVAAASNHKPCTSNMPTTAYGEAVRLSIEANARKYPNDTKGVEVWAKCSRTRKEQLMREVLRGERDACERHENIHK